MSQGYARHSEDFAELVARGMGYAFASYTLVPTAVETNLLLFKNTSATKRVLLYEQVASVPEGAGGVRSVLRVYKNPTVTLDGTLLGLGGLTNGQLASVCQVFSLPTTSLRGTMVQVYGIINTPTQRLMNLTRVVEPLESILITAQPSGTNLNHAFNQAWAEV